MPLRISAYAPLVKRAMLTVYLGAALGLVMFGIVATTLYDERQADRRLAEQHASNLVLALEGDISRSISGLDLSLRAAAGGMTIPNLAALAPDTRQAILFGGATAADGISGVYIFDEAGSLIYEAGHPSPRRISIADRDYFQALARQPDAGLVVSHPLSSHVDGEWRITLARRISRADGSFGGAVVGAVKLSFFQSMFDHLDLGEHDIVSFMSSDGVMITRHPFKEEYVGRDMTGSETFQAVRLRPVGTVEATASIDNVPRLYSYRHLADIPLVLSVGLSLQEIDEAWVRKTTIVGSVLALLSALLIGATVALRRELSRRERAERAIREAELHREQALIKSEARFRHVVEAAPSAMIMVNAAGLIEMVNAQAERMFGYTRKEILGGAVEMLMPNASRAAHRGLREGFMADPEPRPMDARGVMGLRKDGSLFEMEVGLSPIETDEGLMVLSAILDISTRVQMEAQLRQSQKMDAIGRVAAGVAHDFNNLLQALSGSLEMLLDPAAEKATVAQWGQVALRAARRGSELTGRLLSFSRQQVLTARAVPLRPLLNEVKELVNHLFETKLNERNEVVVLSGPEHLAAFADAAQLEAALINLAVNARDAMPAGGRLRITAYESDADPAIVAPGRYTVISVADTGSGMDAATLAQACDPFFTTKGLDGTGLGLSMVQGFARQSGGEAHIISILGEGTTIELWLPSAGPAVAELQPPGTEANTKRKPAGGHVLLVDDAPDVLLIVGSFLRKAGIEVTAVASGDLALGELLRGRPFDAIISDFAMTGLNGMDLLIQAREIAPTLPAMIITGFYDPEVLSALQNVVVLRKPFDRAELIGKVQDLIRGSASGLVAAEDDAAA